MVSDADGDDDEEDDEEPEEDNRKEVNMLNSYMDFCLKLLYIFINSFFIQLFRSNQVTKSHHYLGT